MARTKGGPRAHARHKKVLKAAKGYYGRKSKCFRTALQQVEKSGQYAYRDRRNKKRNFRSLWIQRINAGVRLHGLTYGVFMHGLKLTGLELDRKSLADIAMHDEAGFAALVKQVQSKLPNTAEQDKKTAA